MGDMKDLKLAFTGVNVFSDELAVVTSVRGDVPDDSDVSHELVYIREGGDWELFDAEDRNVIASTYDPASDELAFLSPNGWVIRLQPDSEKREQIDPSDSGPSELVQMKQMKRWPDIEVVVGMARRVYAKRPGEESWQSIDQECFVPRDQRNSAIGFMDISRGKGGEFVAVGYKGEVWERRSRAWVKADSPTNVVLNSVTHSATTGAFLAVGLAGVVLRGDDRALREVLSDRKLGNLWSVAYFNNAFYVAGDNGVFRVTDEPAPDVERVKLSSRGTPTTAYVSAAEEVLWSVGDRDVFLTKDGASWTRVANP
jgi:hypothetical protein